MADSLPAVRRFTYRTLRIEVERIARRLLALGVERGDRVGLWICSGSAALAQ